MTANNTTLEQARTFWQIASGFPTDKESVYLDHAKAHHFDEQAKGRALEYGCGGGSDTISLLRRGGDVFFVDIVPQNVQTTRARVDAFYAKNGGHPPVGKSTFVPGRAIGAVLTSSADIPVHDDCFDSINCHGVLHHIPEQTMHEVIDDMWRVLRPGGRLYAMLYTEHLWARCLPTMKSLQREHGWDLDRAFGRMTDGGDADSWCIARAYDSHQALALFLDHGFSPVSMMDYNGNDDGDFRTYCLKKTERP